jgi:hypothetical protein
VEKIVLLCFLMAVIGVLAEWSRAPHTVGKSFPCRTKSVHFRARSFALSVDIEHIPGTKRNYAR